MSGLLGIDLSVCIIIITDTIITCTRASNSHLNLINKDLFLRSQIYSTSRYTILDIINPSFSIRCRRPS